jgi:hypothetical protein
VVSNKNGVERKINLYGGIGNHLLTSWVLKISDGSVVISDGDTLSHEIFITVLSILLVILSGICASYNPCGYFFFLFVPYYYFWDKVVGSLKVKKFIGDYITKDNMKAGDLDN